MAAAQAIKFFPLFEDVSDQEVESVAKHFTRRELSAGENLYFEKDKADRMFFLYTGVLVLTTYDELGLVRELTRVDEMGAIIGDELLYSDKKIRNCTVTGLKDCILFSLTNRGFERFSSHLPQLAQNIELSALQREKLMYISEHYRTFKAISRKRQHQLASICRIVRFKPGTTIISKGVDRGRQFYIIAGGNASVFLDESTAVRDMGEGDYFGEVGLVSRKPPTATVKVVGERSCYCLTVSGDDFETLFAEEPGVLAEFSIRFLGKDVGLEHVLNHEAARESFLSYCEQEFAQENVEFWKAVEDFERLGKRRERKSMIRALNISVKDVKRQKKGLMVKRATEIIERWVVDNAAEEVSMEGVVKYKILERFKNKDFSYDMFDAAKELVFTIMEGDNFKRYKNSEEFNQLLAELGEYKYVSTK